MFGRNRTNKKFVEHSYLHEKIQKEKQIFRKNEGKKDGHFSRNQRKNQCKIERKNQKGKKKSKKKTKGKNFVFSFLFFLWNSLECSKDSRICSFDKFAWFESEDVYLRRSQKNLHLYLILIYY